MSVYSKAACACGSMAATAMGYWKPRSTWCVSGAGQTAGGQNNMGVWEAKPMPMAATAMGCWKPDSTWGAAEGMLVGDLG